MSRVSEWVTVDQQQLESVEDLNEVNEGDDLSLHSFPVHITRHDSKESLHSITRQSKIYTYYGNICAIPCK